MLPRLRAWLLGGGEEYGVSKDRFLIVGLGNPGREHNGNRHNIGFMAVDYLAERHGIPWGKVQAKALTGSGTIGATPVILAKPQTFMNRSGDAVGPLANYYRIPPENVFVIYDELDLPFGALRLRQAGGSGGHNGMKSIINHLGTTFPRLRLGIGRPVGRMAPADFVLQDFKGAELEVVRLLLDEAANAIETFLAEGIDLAMTKHNRNGEGLDT